MAGNERIITEYLLNNISQIELPYIGLVTELSNNVQGTFVPITDVSQVCTENSAKKADIYINRFGVSIKQSGGSFSFNRLQRANLLELFQFLEIVNPQDKLLLLDNGVNDFHNGIIVNRNRRWQDFFNENDFKKILKFLMMIGSPNLRVSSCPAQYILTGPKRNITRHNLTLQTFEEYFQTHKDFFRIAVRRQWVGQLSDSEHKRALGLVNKIGNSPWVFEDIVGSPRTGWRPVSEYPLADRRTVYFLMIELIRH